MQHLIIADKLWPKSQTLNIAIMFAIWDGAYPQLLNAPFLYTLLTAPKNIGLGWKGLSVTNTIAYQAHLDTTTIQHFLLL
jgi:hypothetical protein